MFDYEKTKPVKESEWMRVYKSREGYVHQSKFLREGLQVSAESIRERWPTFSFEEKLDFANAFGVGGEVTAEDERILDFLMEAGDLPVWMAIAGRLPRHRDKRRVLAFLLDRIGEDHEHKANFLQAIGLMMDEKALPVLRAAFDDYRRRLATGAASRVPSYYRDYLICCETLWKISGSAEYKQVIEDALRSDDELVRTTAELILRSP